MTNVTTTDLVAIDNSSTVTAINTNVHTLRDEFDKVLYKDGREELTDNLNANSQRIYNLGAPVGSNDAVRLSDVADYVASFLPDDARVILEAQRKEIIATSGQTVFSFDFTALAGYTDVYLNGLRLNSTEYSQAGAVITLNTPASNADVIILAGFINGAATTGTFSFLQTGSGATARTALEKLQEAVSVKDFGATGDGTTDDAAAIRAAIAANSGGEIYFPKPAVAYKIGSSLGNIPINTHLRGASKFSTKIRRAYNGGYMANLLDSTTLDSLWFDGDGATYTGGIIDIPVAHGNQSVRDCRFINATGGTPLHFTCTGATDAEASGSRSNWDNIEAWRLDGTSGSNNYAVVHDDPAMVAAGHPISFTHLETGGYDSINFGACNDFYLNNCTLFNLKFSDNSRGIHGVTSRIAGALPYTLKGSGEFIACSWGSAVTIGAAAAYNLMGFFNAGWTDNSANSQTLIYDQLVNSYSPTFYGGGVAFTLGNGSVSGNWVRQGNIIQFQAKCIVGTTTIVPAGVITVSLPEAINAGISAQSDMNGNLNVGGVTYSLGARSASGTSLASLHGANAVMTDASPAVFGGGTVAVIEIGGSFIR